LLAPLRSSQLDGGLTSCFCQFDYSDLEGDNDEEAQPLVPADDATAAPYQSPYQSPFMTPNTLAKRRAAEKEGKKFTKVSRGGSFA